MNPSKNSSKPEAYLLLHGNSGSHQEMEALIPVLRSGTPMFNPDLPQHGKNILQHFPLSIESCASWLMENLPLKDYRLNIIGFSDGANIAMILMQWNQLDIRSVVLLAPNLSWQGLTPWTRFIIRAGSALSCPGSWIPSVRRVGQRMSMMSDYTFSGEIHNLPEKCLLLYGEKEMITPEEQRRVGELLGVSPEILQGESHMSLPGSEALKEIIQSMDI